MSAIRRNRFYLGAVLFVMAGWLWLLCCITLLKSSSFSVCIFKNITGLPCPSCGTTRSVIAIMMHGHVLEGFYLNPIGFIAAACLVVLPLWLAYDLLNGKTSVYASYAALETRFKKQRLVAVVFFLMIAANWLWSIYKQV